MLKCTRNHYLFKKDTCDFIDLQVPGYQCDTDMYTTDIPITGEPYFPYEAISIATYNPRVNAICDNIQIDLSFDRDWCFVEVDIEDYEANQYFVGSVEESVAPKQILESCYGIVD